MVHHILKVTNQTMNAVKQLILQIVLRTQKLSPCGSQLLHLVIDDIQHYQLNLLPHRGIE